MRLKSMLLASCVGAVGLIVAGPAQAGGVYGTLTGAYDMPKANDINTSHFHPTFNASASGYSDHFEVQNGFMVAVAVGWDLSDVVTKGLKVELEGAYRHNNYNGGGTWFYDSVGPAIGGAGLSSSSATGADLSVWSVMANAWYGIDTGGRLSPYFGGGVGWARNKFTPEVTGSYAAQENEGFAWQVGGGLNFNLSPHASIGLGYRYFHTDDVVAVLPTSGKHVPSEIDVDISGVHQDVTISLSYDLN